MIQLSGASYQQNDNWSPGSVELMIVQEMNQSPVVYNFSSLNELSQEIQLRKQILISASKLHMSNAKFSVFAKSYCNSAYWERTTKGGFRLREGISPSAAIQDIYTNSDQYGFECATAMLIIFYHAILTLVGEELFNQLFENIYLYSWHADADLGLELIETEYFLPGDVVYFKNPDVSPQTPYWRGENAVVMGNGKFFGHGIGVLTADEMINSLNIRRRTGSNQSAFLTNTVTRPTMKAFSNFQRAFVKKQALTVVHHNIDSISLFYYSQLLKGIQEN
ncbi:protein-glutamine gamma-glutamyltransferase [Radiobacillus sp. PE A8.2]|uniref:protein-glutamine gamma-glutamyltransferase n=1 Tax=Radiobacillus sp. PE A8.2 TaxID=3380349 RepID=UPI00388E7610